MSPSIGLGSPSVARPKHGEKKMKFTHHISASNPLACLIISLLMLCALTATAQNTTTPLNPEDRQVDMSSPTFVPLVHTGKTSYNNDSIPYVKVNNIYVFPPLEFRNEDEKKKFYRLLYNIKKVLPIAKECNSIAIETYEYLNTIPDQKERKAHLKRVEKDIKAQYGPRMKKLTFSQGKLLIKLIDRETSCTSYELIQSFLGPVRAGFYQAFAWVFGASLKKRYDPNGADRLIERIVLQVEAGQL